MKRDMKGRLLERLGAGSEAKNPMKIGDCGHYSGRPATRGSSASVKSMAVLDALQSHGVDRCHTPAIADCSLSAGMTPV
jgi:hypothetical protein